MPPKQNRYMTDIRLCTRMILPISLFIAQDYRNMYVLTTWLLPVLRRLMRFTFINSICHRRHRMYTEKVCVPSVSSVAKENLVYFQLKSKTMFTSIQNFLQVWESETASTIACFT